MAEANECYLKKMLEIFSKIFGKNSSQYRFDFEKVWFFDSFHEKTNDVFLVAKLLQPQTRFCFNEYIFKAIFHFYKYQTFQIYLLFTQIQFGTKFKPHYKKRYPLQKVFGSNISMFLSEPHETIARTESVKEKNTESEMNELIFGAFPSRKF